MTEYAEMQAIVARRRPELVPVVDRLVAGEVDDEEVGDIQSVLVDELLEFGLVSADEQNAYGRRIELLIDISNRGRPELRAERAPMQHVPKRDTSWRGDSSAVEQGGQGRGNVYGALRRGDLTTAVKTARGIRHPWWRCQSLAIAAMEIEDPKLRLALVDEALSAADELEEPNRIVTVASWPIEVLAAHGPVLRLRREVDRMVSVAGTEPHGLRRADALAMLLHRAWADEPARTRALDGLVSTCRVAHGWRRDRLLASLAPRLAAADPRRAAEVVEMIEGARWQKMARRDVDRVVSGASA